MQEIKSATRDAIVDFFLDFRSYISEVFGSDPDEATLDWNSVGSCIHYLARIAPFSSACGNAPKATSESLT